MSVEEMARGPTQRLMIGGGKHLMFLPQNLTPWTKIPREIQKQGFFVVVALLCFIFCFGALLWLAFQFSLLGAGGRMSKGALAKEPQLCPVRKLGAYSRTAPPETAKGQWPRCEIGVPFSITVLLLSLRLQYFYHPSSKKVFDTIGTNSGLDGLCDLSGGTPLWTSFSSPAKWRCWWG